jgi:ferritin-like metal-binding protein YciE
MAIQNAEEHFINGLTHTLNMERRLQKVVDEMSQAVDDPEIKDILSVRSYLTGQAISNIEKCFELLGKQPVSLSGRFAEALAEDCRGELSAIQSPAVRTLWVLGKVRAIQNLHIGEYGVLTAMARAAGNYPVAALLERNLTDKVEFVERTRDVFAAMAKRELAGKLVARARARAA